MSTLWTPDGEIQVGKQPQTADSKSEPRVKPSDANTNTAEAVLGDPLSEAQAINLDDLTPEERERAEEAIGELAKTREKLLEIPAATVVANHAMGLYELAALHLANQPPNFSESSLAIDALGALLQGMAGRLGEPEPILQEGLEQIRMSFVKLKRTADANTDSDSQS